MSFSVRVHLLLTLALFTALAASGQALTVTGRVLSSEDGEAMPGATVYVGVNGKPNAMTGADGKFTLSGLPHRTDTLSVFFMGYHTLKVAFTIPSPGTKTDLGEILLDETPNQIDAVVIKAEAPMAIQKGDTTQFNAEAFKTNPDADADELITKMPGIVITNNKIEAQGEPVRKIYVDGKLFFGTDPMAALKNLPADAIESIQLFNELDDMAKLTGYDDGNTSKAINIVTKGKNKTSTMLKAEAAGGVDIDSPNAERYLAGGNYSHFTDKNRLTLTGLVNNVNTAKFGENNMAGESDVDDNGNLKNQLQGIQQVAAAGINYSHDSKTTRFSGSYFFDYYDNHTTRSSESNYYPDPRGNFQSKRVTTEGVIDKTQYNHRINFRWEQQLSPKDRLIIEPDIRLQSYDMTQRFESLTLQGLTGSDPVDSLTRSKTGNPARESSYSISGNASWSHRFEKKGRSLSASLYYLLSNRSNDTYRIDEYRDNYKNEVWNPVEKPTNRLVDQSVDNNRLRLRLSYSEPFKKYHRVILSGIAGREWGSTDKQSNKLDRLTGLYSEKETMLCSVFDRAYNTYGAGLGYSLYKKKLTLSAGVDFTRTDQARDEFEPNVVSTRLSFDDVAPNFSLKYSIEKKRYLRVQFKGRSILPNINNMQNVLNDSSPNNWVVGNPNLRQGYENRLTVFYNATNVQRSTNFTYTLSFSNTENFIASITESLPIDTVVYANPQAADTVGKGYLAENQGIFLHKYTNLNGYYSLRTSGTYSFKLAPIRSNINLTLAYNHIRTPSIYGGVHNFANINSGSFRAGITSNISRNVDFNFYSNTAFNYTRNSDKFDVSYLNQNLYYSMNIIFPGGIVFNTLLTWRYYTTTSTSDTSMQYFLIDAGLGKKFLKKQNAEFRITAYDLLDRNKNIFHYVRNNYIEDVHANTLGRYVMARLFYRFNNMTAPAKVKSPAQLNGGKVQTIKPSDLRPDGTVKPAKTN